MSNEAENKKWKKIGEAIAFSAPAACATVLEINGKPTGVLWVTIVVWAFLF